MPPPLKTNFSCRGRDTGFYADVDTYCRVYHTCDDHGNKFTYYCPAETAFRQEALVCDHAHLVDCAKGRGASSNLSPDDTNDNRYVPTNTNVDEPRNAAGTSSLGDILKGSANSNPAYTRSFRITAEPPSQFSTPKSLNRKQPPTFVLSSSVFLRNRSRFEKNSPALQNNRVATEIPKALANPADFILRNLKKNDENLDFHVNSNYATTPTSTSYEPFRADSKFKDHSTPEASRKPQQGLQFRNFDRMGEEKERFSERSFASSSATTVGPFESDFNAKAGIVDDIPGVDKAKFDYEDNARNSGGRRVPFAEPEVSSRFDAKRVDDNFDNFDSQGRIDRAFGKTPKDVETNSSSGRNYKGFNSNSGGSKITEHEPSSFFFDGNNFAYSETLRSMQARNDKSPQQPNYSNVKKNYSATISPPLPRPGTEFPIHTFTGSLAPLIPNESNDDPYYPKRPTTTEASYKLSEREKGGKKPFRFTTGRPWPGSLDFEIPEVLPDFNTLDDLVDRRKLFFIPRVKSN